MNFLKKYRKLRLRIFLWELRILSKIFYKDSLSDISDFILIYRIEDYKRIQKNYWEFKKFKKQNNVL